MKKYEEIKLINRIQSNSHASRVELSRKNPSDPSAGLIGTMITIDLLIMARARVETFLLVGARPIVPVQYFKQKCKKLHIYQLVNIMKYMN
jgi:hypothetical protein